MTSPRQNRPWPMKWIIVAIILIIIPYTFITLRYRKPGPAFQPYEDMKSRANVARLLEAGYRRISIPARRPADDLPVRGGAGITSITGGLPAELRSTLVETPQLPAEITDVTAAPNTNTLQAYEIRITITLPDDKLQLAGAELFLKNDTAVITPTFERAAGDLQARSRQATVLLTVPPGVLKAGTYTVLLVGERGSRSWPLEVR